MRSIAFAVILTTGAGFAQQKAPAWTEAEQPIFDRIRTLRKLPDDQRGEVTRDLAVAIRNLSGPGQLRLATYLTGLSTEGDFGKSALEEVAKTLATAIEHNRPLPAEKPGSPAMPYVSLAQLIRYEHVQVTLDDPQLKDAFGKLDEDDRLRQAANFTLTDLDGKSWTLKDLRGSVVLVNFWATWCPPCRKEMPDLDALYRRFQGQGLVVLSISDEVEATVRSFLADKGYKYPILLDAGRKVNDAFVVEGIPKSFLYDRDGKLVAQAIDMRTRGQFLEMLSRAGLR